MEEQNKQYIFIGAAWPYANAPLHLGHVTSLLPADIIARYHRIKGNNVLFVSGSDCHGTPIVLAAEKESKSPREVAEFYHEQFKKTLIDGFDFSYDIYTTTLTDNHTKVVQDFFIKLFTDKEIVVKEQSLPYCPNCKRFLPDRYVEGTCPHCNFEDARGDQCDECGTMLDPENLVEPRCKICDTTPEFKKTEHFFLKLSGKEDFIKGLVDNSTGWRKNAIGFTNKLIKEGFRDRAITRDIDWGVDIPLKDFKDKKIYVWFDAVCGYFSASKEISKDGWNKFWENKDAVHYYVHGKDNIPFHTIIWPVMLRGFDNLKLPDHIISSEYLTLEKKQFSKSRNWAVWAKDIVKEFDSDVLRYYLIINGPENSDSDFSYKDFQTRVNSELIGNFGNFINRTAKLIANNFKDGVKVNKESEYLKNVKGSFGKIGDLISGGNLKDALKAVIEIAENGNKYLAEQEPWKKLKDDRESAEDILANCAGSILCAQVLAEPFLPKTAKKIAEIFERESNGWNPCETTSFKVKKSEILFDKIEDSKIEELTQELESGRTKDE